MRFAWLGMCLIALIGCEKDNRMNISDYHQLINEAELNICKENFKNASELYSTAFQKIDKPFGKDVYNAALTNAIIGSNELLLINLQQLVNNCDDFGLVRSVFLGKYIDDATWETLLSKKVTDYDVGLRDEFKEIKTRDQMFRPMYDTHNDTINANRIINIERILELAKTGFPSHQELGYTSNLRGQDHYIVLHHTAQQRSNDKSILDLEALLKDAVLNGRFDPEFAMQYLKFQEDREKGRYEVYSTWQFHHSTIPDSLKDFLWIPDWSEEEITSINEVRRNWYANTLQDIAVKTEFLAKNDYPFIFSSVKKSIVNLSEEMGEEEALTTYQYLSESYKKYINE
jgi:hypothetical protein